MSGDRPVWVVPVSMMPADGDTPELAEAKREAFLVAWRLTGEVQR